MSKEQFIREREQKIEYSVEAGLTEEEAERLADDEANNYDPYTEYRNEAINNLKE